MAPVLRRSCPFSTRTRSHKDLVAAQNVRLRPTSGRPREIPPKPAVSLPFEGICPSWSYPNTLLRSSKGWAPLLERSKGRKECGLFLVSVKKVATRRAEPRFPFFALRRCPRRSCLLANAIPALTRGHPLRAATGRHWSEASPNQQSSSSRPRAHRCHFSSCATGGRVSALSPPCAATP